MFGQRFLRLLPGRPHLLLALGFAAVLVFAFGFINLAVERQSLQGRYERALTKVERLQDQNVQLQQNLTREQAGQHLPDRAWQYFGKAPRGAGVIVVAPDPAPATAQAAGQAAAQETFWARLWKRLTRP